MSGKKDWEEPTFTSAPITRIPIKTSLSNVLLMTNPWEQRDLDKKLAYISKERQRREKVLEWNQRHFFVRQIFDADYKLRFTEEKKKYSDELTPKSRSEEPTPSESLHGADILHIPSFSASDRGPDFTQSADRVSREAQVEPILPKSFNKLGRFDKISNGIEEDQQRPHRESNQTLPPLIPKAQGTGIFLPTKDSTRKSRMSKRTNLPHSRSEDFRSVSNRDSVFPQMSRSMSSSNQEPERAPGMSHSHSLSKRDKPNSRRITKCMSLPQIPIDKYRKGHEDKADETFLTNTPLERELLRRDTTSDSGAEDTSNNGSDLISDITSRLPMSLMIKANQRVNKVVYKRKRKWIQEAKRTNENQASLLKDPRYVGLKDILVK